MNRVNISVTMTAMANSSYSSTYDLFNSTAELCPARSNNDNEENVREGEFPWDAHTQEQILAAIYYGFPILQVPAGILADKYPQTCIWLIGVGYLLSAIFTLFVPLAAYAGGAPLIITLRILSGLSESGTYPGLYSLMSRWAPPADRSKLLAIVFAGSSVGQIIAQPISGILSESDFLGGWPSTFYLFGSLEVLWCILWFLVIYPSPMAHPRISQEEKDYIMAELKLEDEPPKDYPWKHFFTSLPLLAVVVADFALMWVLYSLTSNLPIFLKEALRFDISQAGILSAVPHIVFFIFILGGGVLADFLLSHTNFSITTVRKFMTTIGILPSGIFLVLAGYVGCNAPLAITFISLGLACTGLAYSGSCLSMMELATPYAGMVVAVSYSIATFTGFISPAVVAMYTENQADIAGWRSFFWVTFGITVVAWLLFMIFGTSELQPWAKGDRRKDKTEHRETKYGGIIDNGLEYNSEREEILPPDYT
ncbi:sialin [Strongylocentrotus purpuratus]|uniref:Major facilitator superfamily (MFS) profile domain-containing protein n=1 Tax=Strongylocentrotus purpuratus TaxID=7668 RepID=A0A7M7RE04_STRPU|nr:sialin [Strongylocentrotus purpuratus]